MGNLLNERGLCRTVEAVAARFHGLMLHCTMGFIIEVIVGLSTIFLCSAQKQTSPSKSWAWRVVSTQ
jgi:hypothetical protein